MKPEEQKTLEVLERIYRLLLVVKWNKTITHYAHDCFTFGFGMPYQAEFCNLTQERKNVVNNIPYILGAIGYVCNDNGLPPLSCLVVNQDTGDCGVGVVTSKDVPKEEKAAFVRDVDCPAVYNCDNYPQPGTQAAENLLSRAMEYLRKDGIARE